MRHIKNLDQWYPVAKGSVIVYRGTQDRTVELEINAIGPCAVYVQQIVADSGDKPQYIGEKMLLGLVEGGLETFRWRLGGDFAVRLDPSGEVWCRRDQTPLSLPAPEGESYTRLEKAGLYTDDLGIALHRQAVLSRLAERNAVAVHIRANEALEARLEALSAKIASLTVPEVKPPFVPAPLVPAPQAQADA